MLIQLEHTNNTLSPQEVLSKPCCLGWQRAIQNGHYHHLMGKWKLRVTNPGASGSIVGAVSSWVSPLPSCPLALNSNPRKWVIPQRWIKTWTFKNAGSSENRSGKEEVGEDVCVGTGHRNCPGCTWWAFLCVQRTAMQVTHLFCPHIPSFLLAVLADWSHQRWWGRCKRITHWRTTQSWRLPLPSAKYGHQIQLLSYNVNRHHNLWMMNQRSPLSHTDHNVPAPGRLHCRKPMCSRWGVFVVLVLIVLHYTLKSEGGDHVFGHPNFLQLLDRELSSIFSIWRLCNWQLPL